MAGFCSGNIQTAVSAMSFCSLSLSPAYALSVVNSRMSKITNIYKCLYYIYLILL